MSYSVLVVDDHALVRCGLRVLLARLGVEVFVCEAATVAQAIEALAVRRYDLVVYDWHLPHAGSGSPGGGVRGLVAVCESQPGVPVLVISADDDEAVRYAALQLGASDYCSKSIDPRELIRKVSMLLQPGSAAKCAAAAVPAGVAAAPHRQPQTGAPRRGLTARQREVLALLSRGEANKRIASVLGLAEPTVRAHVSGLLKALRAKNRTEAVVKARAEGLSDWQESAGLAS